MRRIPIDELENFCISILTSKGLSEENARTIAEPAVLTDAFGIRTHGLACLFYSLDQIKQGNVDTSAMPEVVADHPASAVINGERVLGQLAFKMAKDMAVQKARTQGVAMVGVHKTTWIGAVGPYLLDIPEQGMLAQAHCQTSGCKDCAPVGGIDAKFSTNPIAVAFPASGTTVVADFSTASYAMGKVATMTKEGKKAPEEIFLDADGNLTDDPGVVSKGGSILFTGGQHFGHKGYALSLWCEALTVVSGGSANNPDIPTSQSIMLTVINPDCFAGSDYYTREMTRFVTHLKQNRLRPGFDEIRLPGERGMRALAESRKTGIELTAMQKEKLDELAEECGLKPLS